MLSVLLPSHAQIGLIDPMVPHAEIPHGFPVCSQTLLPGFAIAHLSAFSKTISIRVDTRHLAPIQD